MPSTSTFPSIWAHGYHLSNLTSLELDHQGVQADYQHPPPQHTVTVSLQPTRSPIESTTHHTSQLRPSNFWTRLLSNIPVHPSITAKMKPIYTQVHDRVYSTVSLYQLPFCTWLSQMIAPDASADQQSTHIHTAFHLLEHNYQRTNMLNDNHRLMKEKKEWGIIYID